METLKPLDQITQPDERNLFFVVRDRQGNQRPQEIADLHRAASSIVLNPSVPESVRSHFAQALNLSVYSWFHYQFHVTADFMSMVTVEFALRERLKPDGHAPFKKLVARAVREGLIKDEGFAVARGKPAGSTSYVETLVEVLPDLRNGHAHGTFMLHNGAFTSLRIAADFINQLFPHESG